MTAQLRAVAMTILGIVLALTPPALWVAWSQAAFVWILAAGAGSAALLILLHAIDPDDAAGDGGSGTAVWPPDAAAADLPTPASPRSRRDWRDSARYG